MTTYHNTPGSAKKQRENTEPESRQMAKRQKCSSFFFFFSFFFRRASSKLWLFHDGYYTEQCTSSMLFHNLKSHKAVQTGHWTTMASSATPFSKLVCMHTNHLATKQLLFKIAELEIQLCAWRQGNSLASIVDLEFEQSLVNDSSANTSTEEAYEDRLAALWYMANFSSSMQPPVTKKSDKQD